MSIDFLLAGDSPGDGRPKDVRFPDPALVALREQRYPLLSIERLLELKLAERLAPSVRAKYRERWLAARSADPDEGR